MITRRKSVELVALAIYLGSVLGMSALPAEAKREAIPAGQSLIIMSKPGQDPSRFRARLEKKGLTVVNEIKCATDSFAIWEVQPRKGSVKTALAEVRSSKDEDLEAAEIKPGARMNACTPSVNDPEFPSQANLQVVNFGEMRCLLDSMGVTQQVQSRITIVDSGVTPIANEMTDVTQYNFANGATGVLETPTDSGNHGTGVASVAATRTNNATLLAGVASHTIPNVKVISLRVGDDVSLVDFFDVLRAMTWCVDHHAERGGAGVINLSINAFVLPTYNGSSIVQGVAKSMQKHDDLLVNAAGNEGFEDPSKEKYLRRVAGLDETEQLWEHSNYGPFKAAAPAVNVRLYNTLASAAANGTGTSFAGPCWAGCVALLMSLNPKLTAPKADKLLFKEGRETAQGWIVPDLRAAVIKALKLKP
ncbi:MAG: S8 family serine peptidase [Candidatus Obscuribacterales bacterium]|nr:S8 family serine peptidase [Candidatus Obscuribacterales bacterium]